MEKFYIDKLKQQIEEIKDLDCKMMFLILIDELQKQYELNSWLVKELNETKALIQNKQIKSISYVWTKNGIKKIEKDLNDEKD